MQQRDYVDAPVGQALVLEHEHRRAAGVGAGDDVESVHTDLSVGILPRMAKTQTRRRRKAHEAGARLDQRTRAARAERRAAREELLAAALRVFARRGYREAGVDEIAAEAGYSKGALYWHFTGKHELFVALIDERIDAPTRALVELLGSAPPDRDMSLEATRELARQLGEQPEAMLLEREYWSLAIRDPELRTRYAERQMELRTAF